MATLTQRRLLLNNTLTIPTRGLVAQYPFQDGSGMTLTDVAHGNNATLVNTPTWTSQGLALAAASLQYVTLPALGITTGATTIVAAQLASAGSYPSLVGTTVGDRGLALQFSGGSRIFRAYVGSGAAIAATATALATPTIFSGRLRPTQDVTAWEGLSQVGAASFLGTGPTAFTTQYIGYDGGAGFTYFDGTIYYGLFYGCALTDGELAQAVRYVRRALAMRGVLA